MDVVLPIEIEIGTVRKHRKKQKFSFREMEPKTISGSCFHFIFE